MSYRDLIAFEAGAAVTALAFVVIGVYDASSVLIAFVVLTIGVFVGLLFVKEEA